MERALLRSVSWAELSQKGGVTLNIKRWSCQEKGMFSSEKDGRQGKAKRKGKVPSGECTRYLCFIFQSRDWGTLQDGTGYRWAVKLGRVDSSGHFQKEEGGRKGCVVQSQGNLRKD